MKKERIRIIMKYVQMAWESRLCINNLLDAHTVCNWSRLTNHLHPSRVWFWNPGPHCIHSSLIMINNNHFDDREDNKEDKVLDDLCYIGDNISDDSHSVHLEGCLHSLRSLLDTIIFSSSLSFLPLLLFLPTFFFSCKESLVCKCKIMYY